MTLDTKKVFFLTILIVFLFLVQGFIIPAIWAGIVYIGILPIYDRFNLYLKIESQKVKDYLFFALFSIFLVINIAILFRIFYIDISYLIVEVNSIRVNGWDVPENLKNIPYFGEQIYNLLKTKYSNPEKVNFLLKTLDYDILISYARNIGVFTIGFLIKFFIFLASYFFLLTNKDLTRIVIQKSLIEIFGSERTTKIEADFLNGIRAIFNNIVLVSICEAMVLFPLYMYFDVPHAALFAILTGVLSIIPGLAQSLIIMISAYLFIFYSSHNALIILIAGNLVNGFFDNFFRPYLIQRSIKMPIILVVIGIFGGIQTWGILGIFLGPILMGFFSIAVAELTNISEKN